MLQPRVPQELLGQQDVSGPLGRVPGSIPDWLAVAEGLLIELRVAHSVRIEATPKRLAFYLARLPYGLHHFEHSLVFLVAAGKQDARQSYRVPRFSRPGEQSQQRFKTLECRSLRYERHEDMI